MPLGNCFNCGDNGHFASSCPLNAAKPADRSPTWHAAPRRWDQDRINEQGIALCRAAIAARAAPPAA